jgi:hypothetical protein
MAAFAKGGGSESLDRPAGGSIQNDSGLPQGRRRTLGGTLGPSIGPNP